MSAQQFRETLRAAVQARMTGMVSLLVERTQADLGEIRLWQGQVLEDKHLLELIDEEYRQSYR